MDQIFAAVFFLTSSNVYAIEPINMPSVETCESKIPFLTSYFTFMGPMMFYELENVENVEVVCGTKEQILDRLDQLENSVSL